ncbi:MAG TPA: AAA family ATPase [Ktedonobacteraceae bacterium]|nr:AAA family ATPase [Ktedonobacteraceae bacterium]
MGVLPGDLSLALLESTLSEAWFQCSGSNNAACRLISSFSQIIQRASEEHQADIVLIDTGSSLGSINRAALIAADYVALPLSEDLLTLQGLHDSGTTLRNWKAEWQSRLTNNSVSELPPARMHPLGYIFIRPLIRLDRPVVGDKDFATRLPATYREHVDGIHDTTNRSITNDPVCLAVLKNYQALMPLAQEAHKPIFLLKPADGAIGSLLQAAQSAYGDFRNLAEKIAERTQVSLSRPS